MSIIEQMQTMAAPFIAKGEALGDVEFWLNRYQTLIAACIALFAAWITVTETRRHAEQSRRDNAERALTRYSMLILDVMDRYGQVFVPQDEAEALTRLKAFQDATDDVGIRSAMADSLFGRDQPMVAFFLNSARFAALAHAYGRDDDQKASKTWLRLCMRP